MKRYLIDKLAKELAWETAVTLSVPAKHLRKPVHSVVMWHDDAATFIPQELLVAFKAGPPRRYDQYDLALNLHTPETAVPMSQFSVEEDGDPVLEELLRANKLDKKIEWWGEVLSVPRLLVAVEIDRALAGLQDTVGGMGVPLAPKFAVYNGDPDKTELLRKEGSLDDAIRDDLRAKLKTSAQKKAFAEICYEDKKRQAWLLKLAGA
jgi:hypothetical protein